MIRSGKTGVDINNIEMEQFDLLRDLEKARANLKERNNDLAIGEKEIGSEVLPLEATKLVEWKSDSSDNEGFQVVESKRSRKLSKKKTR